MQRPLRLRTARWAIPMRQDARNHPGALDARHDLQPCTPTCARLDLDAEHPLEPLRPAHRHMAWPPWLLSGLHRAVCAVAPRAATRRRERRADAIFIDELRKTSHEGKSWHDLTSQAFAVFLPVKAVGVMGDGRTCESVVALRAVQAQDFMTAHWAHLPHELPGRVSNRIINEVRGINRVVYDISGKPPATIEWE